MRILIIEDEHNTALRLKKMINEIDQTMEVLAILDSIESSLRWLSSNPLPDLIFQDIHLADGSGFEIYQTLSLDVPVIFTTAYDQYALEAFQVNSIDYLLKPVSKEQLQKSIDKMKRLIQAPGKQPYSYENLARLIAPKSFQKRFMVRYGQKIKVIETKNIAYFFTFGGHNFFKTFSNDEYPSDFSLDKLEDMLDPEVYFRINRQIIIHIHSIKEMFSYSKSRIKIELNPSCDFETISSTERSGTFKAWLSGKSS